MGSRSNRKILVFSILLALLIHASIFVLLALFRHVGLFSCETPPVGHPMIVTFHASLFSGQEIGETPQETASLKKQSPSIEISADEENWNVEPNDQEKSDEESAHTLLSEDTERKGNDKSTITDSVRGPSSPDGEGDTREGPELSAEDGIYHSTGLPIVRPDPKVYRMPIYPKIARERGYEGTVYIRIKTDSRGKVVELSVEKSSGYPILDSSALKTARKWVFRPARIGESTVEAECIVPVRFSLTP